MINSMSRYIACVALLVTASYAAVADSSLPKETQDNITALLQQAEKRHGIIGQSVAILRGGKLVYSSARGLASIELGVPAIPETVYSIFSVTKLFVITTLMELVEAGKAELDAPVGRYLTDLPANWQTITLRQLLSHMSGLPEYTQPTYIMSKLTEEEALQPVLDKPFEFKTGTATRYNQTNYLLLKRVIEAITDEDLVRVINQRMINRFGLKNTRFGGEYDIVPGRASRYGPSPTGLKRIGQTDFPQYYFVGTGLNSNVLDLATWFEALLSGRMISLEALQSIWQPLYHTDGRRAPYANGWQYGTAGGVSWVGHYGGDIINVRHYFRDSDPTDSVTIIHLTNGRKSSFFDMLDFSSTLASQLMSGIDNPLRILRGEMFSLIESDNWPLALARFKGFKRGKATSKLPTEAMINSLGYQVMLGVLGAERALPLFQLNVEQHPQSANAYDSLGENYLKLGNIGLARENYKKALALDTDNNRIKKVLADLDAEPVIVK